MVRDYAVELQTGDGQWVLFANVTDNYQRRRIHNAEAASEGQPHKALRVTVSATRGIAEARIMEVRIYDHNGLAPFPDPQH